jgi:hypothetical protein
MTNECGAVAGMRISRVNRSSRRKTAQYHFVHHKSHMTTPARRSGKPAANRQRMAFQTIESRWFSGCFFRRNKILLILIPRALSVSGWENILERLQLEDQETDGRITWRWICESRWCCYGDGDSDICKMLMENWFKTLLNRRLMCKDFAICYQRFSFKIIVW